jgi:hypothetical protein
MNSAQNFIFLFPIGIHRYLNYIEFSVDYFIGPIAVSEPLTIVAILSCLPMSAEILMKRDISHVRFM